MTRDCCFCYCFLFSYDEEDVGNGTNGREGVGTWKKGKVKANLETLRKSFVRKHQTNETVFTTTIHTGLKSYLLSDIFPCFLTLSISLSLFCCCLWRPCRTCHKKRGTVSQPPLACEQARLWVTRARGGEQSDAAGRSLVNRREESEPALISVIFFISASSERSEIPLVEKRERRGNCQSILGLHATSSFSKSKTKEPPKFFSSSGIIMGKLTFVYNFSAQ